MKRCQGGYIIIISEKWVSKKGETSRNKTGHCMHVCSVTSHNYKTDNSS